MSQHRGIAGKFPLQGDFFQYQNNCRVKPVNNAEHNTKIIDKPVQMAAVLKLMEKHIP